MEAICHHQPITSVKEVQSLIGTSYPAANQLVQRLVELERWSAL